MLFFQLDFLLLYLTPVLFIAAVLKAFDAKSILPWLASLASLIFLYAFSEISVAIALFSIVVNYWGARLLLRERTRLVLGIVITINLLVLAYFKYSILIDQTLFGNTLSLTWRLALPLGISFYTFQQIAFVCDVLPQNGDFVLSSILHAFQVVLSAVHRRPDCSL